jgi:hypothetical protein
MARIARLLVMSLVFIVILATAPGQRPSAPAPQPVHIAGTVTDTNGDIIPGATVLVTAPAQNSQSTVANDTGSFQVNDLTPGTVYRVTVSAKGFDDWKSSEILLQPGQFDFLSGIKLSMLGRGASVVVVALRRTLR